MMSTKGKFLISIVLVLSMGALMLYTESLAGGESGIIVKLELVPTLAEAEQLVAKYDDEHLQWLRVNTLLDFVFILTYTALFFFALKGLLDLFGAVPNYLLLLGVASLPGVLDVVENIFILQFLDRDFSTSYFEVYYWCVHVKWTLVVIFILLSLGRLGLIIYDALVRPSSSKV
jgi:hypothetical protein